MCAHMCGLEEEVHKHDAWHKLFVCIRGRVSKKIGNIIIINGMASDEFSFRVYSILFRDERLMHVTYSRI